MIYIYSPKHTQCYFIQVMKAMCYELNHLDDYKYKCEIISDLNTNYISSCNNVIIIFGFHDICRNKQIMNYIKNFTTIVYNSEQLHIRDWAQYLNALKNIDYIWDYSINNIELLNKKNINNTTHVPLGYSKGFIIDGFDIDVNDNSVENNVDKDTRDNKTILFIGNMNTRRYQIIDKIDKLGEDVLFLTNTWGDKYDDYVKKNNLFLNIHYYPNPILELFRIVPLLCNGCSVLSEYSYDKKLDTMYDKYIGFFKDDMSNLSTVKRDLLKRRKQICTDFRNELKFSDILKKSGILEHLV